LDVHDQLVWEASSSDESSKRSTFVTILLL